MIQRIQDFAPDDCEAGVGLALENGAGHYLFFLAGTRHRCPPGELFYAGIGGHREPGESWTACAHREAQEEVGAEVGLLSSAETWHIPQNKTAEKVTLTDRPSPLALYEMIHSSDAPRAGQLYRIVVYRARLLSAPKQLQLDEVQGVIALTTSQIAQSLARKPTLAELLAEGATIVAGAEMIDKATRLYPIGTARALGLIFAQGR